MVQYEERDRVAVLTLDRPEARNAVNGDVARGLEAAIDRLEGDDDIWIGVLSHNGPVFSAGADLKIVGTDPGQMMTERGGFAGIVTREREKPIIAAVDGPAFAGGCEIALACDLIVASREASFGLPEVKRSLVAAAGGLYRLPRILPWNVALELALTGDPIDAGRAADLGMVSRLCDPGQALDEALALAGQINANAPLAVRASRRVMLDGMALPDVRAGIDRANQAFGALAATEDFAEGPLAFIEKRDPEWKGR